MIFPSLHPVVHVLSMSCDEFALRSKYIITESDTLESFLCVHMIREQGSLYLSQPGKIAKLVAAAELSTTDHIYHNPMRESFNDEDQDNSPMCDHTVYKSLLGGLIFVLRSRPDIAYAVNRLATRSTKATGTDSYDSHLRV